MLWGALLLLILLARPAWVGAACMNTALSPLLTVDQMGYAPSATKIALLRDPQTGADSALSYAPAATLAVKRVSDHVTVFTVAPVAWNGGATHAQSGDKVWSVDFSSLTTPGTYYVADLTAQVRSPFFVIGANPYAAALREAVRTFYYQRSGFAKATPYADARWVDSAAQVATGQDTQARSVLDQANAGTAKDLRGGWFDAGDLNKYTVWGSYAVTDLLLAYEQNTAAFGDASGIPESGNGLPDILDEVKWELDWLLRMQQGDGSVLSKVSFLSSNYAPGLPSLDTRPRYWGAASTASTAAAAAAYALGSKVFAAAGPGQAAYASTLQTAAVNAWNWTVTNPAVVYDNAGFGTANPEPTDQGMPYGTTMERLRAAVWLYAITSGSTYKTYVEANYTTAHALAFPYWNGHQGPVQAALLYYTTLPGITAGVGTAIVNSKVSSIGGSEFVGAISAQTDAYRAYLKDADYVWGSNRVKAQVGNTYADFLRYNLDTANHPTYRTAAQDYLHNLHGVNPLGLMYLTAMGSSGGTRFCTKLYHSWHAGSANGPPPGFVVGGPNAGYDGNQTPPLGQPPQKAFRDFDSLVEAERAYEVSENGIYYQSAYVRLLSAFVTAP